MTLIRANSSAEYWFEEGCWISELSNSPADPGLSVARVRVPPGATTRWHSLAGIVERYLIESGRGRVELGNGLREELQSGDVIVIEAGMAQRIVNVGANELHFLALCTPR